MQPGAKKRAGMSKKQRGHGRKLVLFATKQSIIFKGYQCKRRCNGARCERTTTTTATDEGSLSTFLLGADAKLDYHAKILLVEHHLNHHMRHLLAAFILGGNHVNEMGEGPFHC